MMLFLHQIKKYWHIIIVLFLVLIVGVVLAYFFLGTRKTEVQKQQQEVQQQEEKDHPFAGGSGTENDPYQIANVEQLQAIDNYLNSHFVLINDIDASDTKNWNEGEGFKPIGGGIPAQEELPPEKMFNGSFNGQGFKIINLYINRPEAQGVALFGHTSGAMIKNVRLENINVTGFRSVAGLVGYSGSGTIISNSYSTGSVGGDYFAGGGYSIGGLVGVNHGTITNSYSTCSVSDGDVFGAIGGLAGVNKGTITNSYSTGSVSRGYGIGGLVDTNTGIISNSYFAGSISDGYSVGGLVGVNYEKGTISNSYSTGSIRNIYSVGGLVGQNLGTITNSYSTCSVSDYEEVGGLVEENRGTVSNSFWDIETSGIKRSAGGTGKTTKEMKNVRTYTDVNWSKGLTFPWDFVSNPYNDKGNENIWNWDKKGIINNGYPFLVDIEGIKEPLF